MDGRTRGRDIPGRENRKGKGQRVYHVQGLLPLLGGREWECEVLSSFTVIKAMVYWQQMLNIQELCKPVVKPLVA